MLAIIIIFSSVLLDQVTKYFVVEWLKGNKPITIIERVLSFSYVENRGAAFGILQEKKIFFIIITIITLIILTYILVRYYRQISIWLIIALSLVYGGTIGNFIDRVRLNYVIDFISVRILDRYNFAVFNIADMCIVIGGFILIIYIAIADSK